MYTELYLFNFTLPYLLCWLCTSHTSFLRSLQQVKLLPGQGQLASLLPLTRSSFPCSLSDHPDLLPFPFSFITFFFKEMRPGSSEIPWQESRELDIGLYFPGSFLPALLYLLSLSLKTSSWSLCLEPVVQACGMRLLTLFSLLAALSYILVEASAWPAYLSLGNESPR